MNCEYCGRRPGAPKVIVAHNKKRTVYLCPECEAKLNAERARLQNNRAQQRRAEFASLRCKSCGWTGEDLMDTDLVGCEHCYVDLAPAVGEAIRRSQPSGVHVGKAPIETGAVRGGEYEHLRTELDRAVKEERYGDAARIKLLLDRLKEGK